MSKSKTVSMPVKDLVRLVKRLDKALTKIDNAFIDLNDISLTLDKLSFEEDDAFENVDFDEEEDM